MNPRYPHITVTLMGQDGNAFIILGLCQKAAQAAGLPKSEIDAFYREATSGDYDHLIRTALQWFNCQ
jgi:hypothetical protein